MTGRRNKETAMDDRTDVVEGTVESVTDEPLDAGLADAEMTASQAAHDAADPGYMEDEQATQDGWGERINPPDADSIPPLVETVETVLFHPHLQPKAKVLMLALVWIGQPMTAVSLASGSGLTKTEVFHALKHYVDLGIVTESMVPTKQPPWRFDRHYAITGEARAWLADRLTDDAKKHAAPDDAS